MSNTVERDIAVVFSDWHVHKFKAFAADDERLRWSLQVIEDLGNICKAVGAKKILFAGDLWHTHGVLLTEVVDRVIEAMLSFFEIFPDITIYAISGNHDHASKNLLHKPAITGLSIIERISAGRFVLIDNAAAMVSPKVMLHGIPYYEQKEDFDAQLTATYNRVTEALKNDPEISHQLMIHQTPLGLSNRMIPWDTDPEDKRYKVFSRVWCGHIHINLDLAENFTIVGNPNQNDSADAGKKKGVLITNLAKPEKGYNFAPLNGYPEFIKVKDISELDEETANSNYIVVEPDMEAVFLVTEKANMEEFNTALESETILENFWRETTGGKDGELLSVGLGFLKHA